jgi:fucose permease
MMRIDRTGLLLTALAYLGFVSLGLPDGLLGIAWPSIRATFGLSLDALGGLLVMFTAGYLASSFTSGWLLGRIGVGALLALSCAATALSLLGYALAPAWWVMVVLGTLAGLGAGAIDAGLNTFAAIRFSARTVNWLHACYGVGAASGPVIMTSVLAASGRWQHGYAIVGGAQLLLALCFALTRRWWPTTGSAPSRAPSAAAPSRSSVDTLRRPVVWMSMAVFFVYTGVEAAAGTWAYSLFTEARGLAMHTAGMWVSVYWAALTAGRLLSGVVVSAVSVERLLRGCMIGIVLGAGLVWLNVTTLSSCLGLGLMGLASAPIFPSLISTTPARLGAAHTAHGVGFQIAAAVLGQSLLPATVGVVARSFGLESVGAVLFTAALVLLAAHEALTALAAPSSSASPLDGVSAGREE